MSYLDEKMEYLKDFISTIDERKHDLRNIIYNIQYELNNGDIIYIDALDDISIERKYNSKVPPLKELGGIK